VSVGPRAAQAPGVPRRALTSRDLYGAAWLLFFAAIFYRFFGQIVQVLLVVYTAAILAVGLNAVIRRIPTGRARSAAVMGVLALLMIAGGLWWGGQVLLRELRAFVEQAPMLLQQIEGWLEWIHARTGFDPAPLVPQLLEWGRAFLTGVDGARIIGGARSVLEALFFPILVLIGGLYAAGRPNEGLLNPVLRALPEPHRSRVRRLFALLGERLLGWLQGQLVAMFGVGLLATLAFSIIGVPYAVLLGVFYGLVEFVPILGPILGGIPAVLVAFLVDPMTGVWTLLAMVIIQQIESSVITPFAMARAAHLHPFVTLFSLVLFGSLFGLLGILLALPLMLLLWTAVEVLWVEAAIATEGDPIDPLVTE
jgi:predicted PurR-regulated permease PerM